MSVAIPIPLLQHLPDVNVTLGVGVDEYALTYDHDTAKFVLRAPAAPFAGLLATGATVGATAQAQAFTLGIVSPFDAPAADGTTAWQVRKADKTTAVVTVDTTNARVGIGTTAPGALLHIYDSGASNATFMELDSSGQNLSGLIFANQAALKWILANRVLDTNNLYISASPIDVTGTNIVNAAKVTIQQSGNVGIGTTAPATALHVVGAATITGGIRPAANSTTALQLQNAAGTSVLNVDTTNGNVGIGTTGPTARLSVIQNVGNVIGLIVSEVVNDGVGSIRLGSNVSKGCIIWSDGGMQADYNGLYLASNEKNLSFAQANTALPSWGIDLGGADNITFTGTKDTFRISRKPAAGSYSELFRITNTGLVGIGTTSPATRLDIDAGALTMAEMTAPTGVANKGMYYTRDNGSGKTMFCCKLGDDVEIVIATQA